MPCRHMPRVGFRPRRQPVDEDATHVAGFAVGEWFRLRAGAVAFVGMSAASADDVHVTPTSQIQVQRVALEESPTV